MKHGLTCALWATFGAGMLVACGSSSDGGNASSTSAGAAGATGDTGGSAGMDRNGTGGARAGAGGEGIAGANANTGGEIVGFGGEWAAFGGNGTGGSGTGGSGTGGSGTGGEIIGFGGEWAAFGGSGTGGAGTGGEIVGFGGEWAAFGGTGSGGDGTGGVVIGTGGDAGGSALCGGVECGETEECCGPSECGHCINAFTGPVCADSCPTRACGDDGLECYAAVLGFQGQLCVETQLLSGESVFKCEYNPCGPDEELDCSCARALCADGTVPGPFCRDADAETLTLSCEESAAVCASPDTPIATPSGERPIASLSVGDLVYSAHEGALLAVPLARVSRTPVSRHQVVRVETADGVVLEISALHPTSDGRTFADLQVGDALDGARIVSRKLVPYQHAFTYDILPASETGTYVAGGKLIGSTLSPNR